MVVIDVEIGQTYYYFTGVDDLWDLEYYIPEESVVTFKVTGVLKENSPFYSGINTDGRQGIMWKGCLFTTAESALNAAMGTFVTKLEALVQQFETYKEQTAKYLAQLKEE